MRFSYIFAQEVKIAMFIFYVFFRRLAFKYKAMTASKNKPVYGKTAQVSYIRSL